MKLFIKIVKVFIKIKKKEKELYYSLVLYDKEDCNYYNETLSDENNNSNIINNNNEINH